MTKSTQKSFNAPWLLAVQRTCSSACLTKKHALQVTVHAAKYHQTHHFHIARMKNCAFGSWSPEHTISVVCVFAPRVISSKMPWQKLMISFGPLPAPFSSSFLFLSVQENYMFTPCALQHPMCFAAPLVLCSTLLHMPSYATSSASQAASPGQAPGQVC